MGVLRVFEGCCRVFEVCLKGVWKNKIEVKNPSDILFLWNPLVRWNNFSGYNPFEFFCVQVLQQKFYTNFTSNFSGPAICNFVSVLVLPQSASVVHLSSL